VSTMVRMTNFFPLAFYLMLMLKHINLEQARWISISLISQLDRLWSLHLV
jgi:hypothetical protein